MSPVKILNLFVRLACQLRIYIDILTLLVAPVHPEQKQDARDENQATSREIQPVTNGEIGAVVW